MLIEADRIVCARVTGCICDLHIASMSENAPVPNTQPGPDIRHCQEAAFEIKYLFCPTHMVDH